VAAAVRAIRRKPQLSGGSLTFTLLGSRQVEKAASAWANGEWLQ